jgi:hypothetical protein
LANIVGDVDSLHVEIDNLNDPFSEVLLYKKYRWAVARVSDYGLGEGYVKQTSC